MRQSKLFTKTRKEAPKDEVAKNAELLIRAGFIDKQMAGVYALMPFGLRVVNHIARIIREELDSIGGEEVLLPALHPLENYQKTGRDTLDILFRTELAGGGELVLGQSHEEVVVPLVQHFIHSYRDLPLSVYQIQTKFRNELRAKSGILRGREFLMQDLYSFHADGEDFDAFYVRAAEAYRRIFERTGIGDATYYTYASGGSFSKYSHEFQMLTEAGEDTIYICPECEIAINDEIIDDLKKCPQCGMLKDALEVKRSIEVGNIFPLSTKFSDAFGLTYKDEAGQAKPVIMGCYGIGLGRLMGAITEVHGDETKGSMLWPDGVSPFSLHLILLPGDEAARVQADCLYEKLKGQGVEVLYDDRDLRPGQKFADADLIGIPNRAIISARTAIESKVEHIDRRTGETQMIVEDELLTC